MVSIVQESVHTQTYTCGFRSTRTELLSLCCLSHLRWVLLVDLTDEKHTTYTHMHCNEYTAGAEDLTKLNFPLLPFPIFHMPQRRRTCVGKNDAHHRNTMLHFLYCHCETPLHSHMLLIHSTDLYSFLRFCIDWFLSTQLSRCSIFLTLSAWSLFAINPCLPSLHLFVISVVLWSWPTARERQVQECRPKFSASPPKLYGTVPITMWPTKAFPGLALVTCAPLCCGYRGCH